MTGRLKTLRLALLVLLALCAGVWFFFPPTAGDRLSPTPAVDMPAAKASPREPKPFTQPLPPPGAPLAAIGPMLASRADAGDAWATCRLSTELMRCRAVAGLGPGKEWEWEEKLAQLRQNGNARATVPLEKDLAELRAAKIACNDVGPELEARALHFYRAAALSGPPSSLFYYASGTGFTSEDGYRYLVTPEFDQWRLEAEELMKQAVARGRPEAAMALGIAYATDDGLFPSLVANDPRQALAYLRLTQRVFGDSLAVFPIPLPAPTLPAADVERADALAADWHQAYFGGRQFDTMELLLADAEKSWLDAAGADACAGEAEDHG